MKTIVQPMTTAFGVILIAVTLTVAANAECGDITRTTSRASIQPQSWQGSDRSGQASLLRISNDSDAIVGLWQVTLTAQGNPGPPDGTVLDKGFSQWHSDGTEILNSSRAPATGSYCLGVWKKVGRGHYKLNHFALSWDENSNFVGVANIREEVVVSRDGKNYAGTFALNQYDQAGNTLAHVIGVVNGTRITVDTPAGNVL